MRTANATISLLCLLMAACTGEAVSNNCNDHRVVHAQHQRDIAKLSVSYTGEGLVEVTLYVPINKLGDNIDSLSQLEHVVTMQGKQACELVDIEVSQDLTQVQASYLLNCGLEENSLKQVDVKLLNTFPDIEEVEADIVMPAVRKYFAINRQCVKPIFKL